MKVLKINYNFSIQQLGSQRLKFKHKICFKKDRLALQKKTTPTIALSSRLFRDGNSLRLYKVCQRFFINSMLSKVSTLPHNNEFKSLFYQYQSFRDFNRVLFWKIMSINSLFNLKKLKNKKLLYYFKPERRCVLVLLWLKNIIKLKKNNYKNLNVSTFNPLFNFIFQSKENNNVYSLKLKIYKLRVVRG